MKIRLELGPVDVAQVNGGTDARCDRGGMRYARTIQPRHGLRDLFGGASGNLFSHTVESV